MAVRSRLIPTFLLLGCAAVVVACAGAAEDYSGFESAKECLRAMPLVRSDIEADALGERCGVSVGMAEIALDAATASGVGGVSGSGTDVPGSGAPAEGDGSLIIDNPDSGDTSSGSTGSVSGSTSSTRADSTSADSTSADLTTTTSIEVSSTTELVGGIEVPDVRGLDHQLAQDTMQFAGLRNLAEEDASGEDRRLIWDRNWIVVNQEPAPGTVVSSDTKITLFSLKDDEVED